MPDRDGDAHSGFEGSSLTAWFARGNSTKLRGRRRQRPGPSMIDPVSWDYAFEVFHKPVLSRAELRALGATRDSLTSAVRGGFLIRARRDHYLLPSADPHLVEAIRVGGRLACVSLLDAVGVFAFDASKTHIHMAIPMSRSRSPRDRFIALTQQNRDGAELHWRPCPNEGTEFAVDIRDALSQALRCQNPVHALASIDNALHLGLVGEADLAPIFADVPKRLHYLRSQVDSSAESGQETVLRRIIADRGLRFETQVSFDGVGRVDFVVERCLVVEADSREAHDGWERHIRDRGRDLMLARQGLMSLRPAYQHTTQQPDLVGQAILSLISRGQSA